MPIKYTILIGERLKLRTTGWGPTRRAGIRLVYIIAHYVHVCTECTESQASATNQLILAHISVCGGASTILCTHS